MLSNAYFLAKFRFDTAEKEPAKNLPIFATCANPNPRAERDAVLDAAVDADAHAVAGLGAGRAGAGRVDARADAGPEDPLEDGPELRHAVLQRTFFAEVAKCRLLPVTIFEKFWRARSRLYRSRILQRTSKYSFESSWRDLQDVHAFAPLQIKIIQLNFVKQFRTCLLYTSDAADEL